VMDDSPFAIDSPAWDAMRDIIRLSKEFDAVVVAVELANPGHFINPEPAYLH